jgi:arylsulfatase A-like enzyme
MASMLKTKNYHTACIGKWHLGWTWNNINQGLEKVDYSKEISNGPATRGFDYFYGFNGSLDMPPYVYVENDMPSAAAVDSVGGESGFGFWRAGVIGSDFAHRDCLPNFTARAVKYIEEKSRSDKAFFLYLPLPAPHTPILPDERFAGKSGLNPYGDFALMVDDVIGQILNAVEKQGIAENTIIVFTSDNGCSPAAKIEDLIAMGHSPSYIFRGYKADLYDGGHHVPCIVQWKGHFTPHTVSQAVCLTDFMATFAGLTGYELKDNEAEDSYDILPALSHSDYKANIREAIVHHSINGDFTIKQGNWKLLLAPGSGGWSFPRPGKETEGSPQIQLFDMQRDISEKTNLQAEYPEIVKQLKELLISYIKRGRSTPGKVQLNENYPWEQLWWMDI